MLLLALCLNRVFSKIIFLRIADANESVVVLDDFDHVFLMRSYFYLMNVLNGCWTAGYVLRYYIKDHANTKEQKKARILRYFNFYLSVSSSMWVELFFENDKRKSLKV